MAKKECRRRPTDAGWVQTLDFQKRAENDTKKNVTADPQLRAGSKLWLLKKGPKMTKKECRRRPTTANSVETLDFQKRAENDQKRMSPQTQRCKPGRNSGFSKKGRKWPEKNVTADPELRAGLRLWISEKGLKMTQKRMSDPQPIADF